jgi:hypothetical protein
MDLRDQFAVHFAASLVDAFSEPEQVARRAYDLAEAMLAERGKRVDADEEHAISLEPRRESIAALSAPPEHRSALLDEPYPMIDPDEEPLDPSLLEPPYDPSWDVEPRWSAEPSPSRPPAPESARPGLAKAQPPETAEPRKERSAG